MVPGAEHASVSRVCGNRFVTIRPTHPIAATADHLQYDLGTGPCVDAALEDRVIRVDDLRTDDRWPDYGARVHAQTGLVSSLSTRLYLEASAEITGLNLYSTQPGAFDDLAETTAILLATHGALAVLAAQEHDRAENLEIALATNRDIGVAMGVLMAVHGLDRVQAFNVLRIASQQTNRKLRDIAHEVGDTGHLPLHGVALFSELDSEEETS